jgi:hypothetical protein
MAGKGLISEFYQSFLGQVNKEKRCFPADDGIVVNVTLIGHIGRVRSVFLRQVFWISVVRVSTVTR